MSIYNFEPFKSLTAEDYNLLNIRDSPEHPYFFGMGLSSKFNCNYGFKNNTEKPQRRAPNYHLSPEAEVKLREAGIDIKHGVPLEIQE